MSSLPEEGGTKIPRRNGNQISNSQPPPQQQQQQMMQQQQQMMQQQKQQQMMQQQQMMNQQQKQNFSQETLIQPHAAQRNMIVNKGVPNSIKTGRFNISNKNFKNAIIVIVIFILLNSRMVWRALSRMPMMGTVEPSILALIVNSVLSGIVFYIISTNLNKS